MRFIDQEKLRPRVLGVIDAFATAQAAVDAELDPIKRAELLAKRPSTWAELRDIFSEYSHGKCWYTECKNPGTDDDLDHFRPKSRVNDVARHPGYYWLAFDWLNLRLSCHRSNRLRKSTGHATGGKSDKFPLVDESTRAYSPADSLEDEFPELLDPTNPHDPSLLTFKLSGEADLSPGWKSSPVHIQRFEATRLILHLNWPEFCEDRMRLYYRIEALVNRGVRAAPRREYDMGSAPWMDVIRDLINLMHSDEEYSAAARSYVETFGHIWWIKNVVLKVPA